MPTSPPPPPAITGPTAESSARIRLLNAKLKMLRKFISEIPAELPQHDDMRCASGYWKNRLCGMCQLRKEIAEILNDG